MDCCMFGWGLGVEQTIRYIIGLPKRRAHYFACVAGGPAPRGLFFRGIFGALTSDSFLILGANFVPVLRAQENE